MKFTIKYTFFVGRQFVNIADIVVVGLAIAGFAELVADIILFPFFFVVGASGAGSPLWIPETLMLMA